MTKFSLLSWNVQGEINHTGFTPFKNITKELKNISADIFALQEMPDAKTKLKSIPLLRDYHVFVPKPGNNNVIISRYPIIKTEEIVFPKSNLENASKVEIKLSDQVLTVYNCHFGIVGVGPATRLRQLEHIMANSKDHNGPIIICGDLNVTIPPRGWNRAVIRLWHIEPSPEMHVDGNYLKTDERDIFYAKAQTGGFTESFDLYTPTWSPWKTKTWEMFGLKLDWLLTKNLKVTSSRMREYVSDHRALEIECEI